MFREGSLMTKSNEKESCRKFVKENLWKRMVCVHGQDWIKLESMSINSTLVRDWNLVCLSVKMTTFPWTVGLLLIRNYEQRVILFLFLFLSLFLFFNLPQNKISMFCLHQVFDYLRKNRVFFIKSTKFFCSVFLK